MTHAHTQLNKSVSKPLENTMGDIFTKTPSPGEGVGCAPLPEHETVDTRKAIITSDQTGRVKCHANAAIQQIR